MKSKIYKLFYPVMCNYLLNCINHNQYPSNNFFFFFIDIIGFEIYSDHSKISAFYYYSKIHFCVCR